MSGVGLASGRTLELYDPEPITVSRNRSAKVGFLDFWIVWLRVLDVWISGLLDYNPVSTSFRRW